MSRPDGASYATNALREHANILGHGNDQKLIPESNRDNPLSPRPSGTDLASRIRAVADILERGKVPTEVWGAPWASPSPGADRRGGPAIITGEAPPEFQRFYDAYHAAHDAAVSRLHDLAGLYDETSAALHLTADNYDAMEGK